MHNQSADNLSTSKRYHMYFGPSFDGTRCSYYLNYCWITNMTHKSSLTWRIVSSNNIFTSVCTCCICITHRCCTLWVTQVISIRGQSTGSGNPTQLSSESKHKQEKKCTLRCALSLLSSNGEKLNTTQRGRSASNISSQVYVYYKFLYAEIYW